MARKEKAPANPLEDSPSRDRRIRERAYHLWESEGKPHGRDTEFWERAEALIGMEDSAGSGQKPVDESDQGEVVEEAFIQENLGEFPGQLTDQGDLLPAPTARAGKSKNPVSSEAPRKTAAAKSPSAAEGPPAPKTAAPATAAPKAAPAKAPIVKDATQPTPGKPTRAKKAE